MKKLLFLTAALVLVGAGCSAQTNTQADINADVNANQQTPPPSAPPSTDTGAGANAGAGVNAGGTNVDVGANLTANVAINAGGTFAPALITVKQGTKVTWKNDGSAKVWVASDPHPSHIGYPGFDSRTDLGAGESYSFTFDKKGTWGYHNHLNPSVTGTVVVE